MKAAAAVDSPLTGCGDGGDGAAADGAAADGVAAAVAARGPLGGKQGAAGARGGGTSAAAGKLAARVTADRGIVFDAT